MKTMENELIIKQINKYGRVPEVYELLNIIEKMEEENKRLKEDMKVLFEENSNKEKVIIKQNEVIDKLNCMGDSNE